MEENKQTQVKQVKSAKQAKGFTLIELLVAIVMSGIVVTALGAGMMAILNSSKTSAAKTDVKNQLNRAIEYINEDIRRSRVAGISTVDDNGTPRNVLQLTYFTGIDDTAGNTISYYIDDVDADEPWLGPKVLRRQDNNGNWQVLVDRLSDNAITTGANGNQLACNTPPPVAPDTETPLPVTDSGFQACIESSVGSNGANIYRTTIKLIGEVSNAITLDVETDTISRSITPDLPPPVLAFTPSTDVTPLLTWDPILGATSYQIFRCEDDNLGDGTCDPASGELVGGTPVLAPTTTLLDDYDDQPSTVHGNHYCYAGISLNGDESGQFGNTICTIKSPVAVPPDLLAADFVVSNEVQPELTWPRNTEAVDYEIYRCESDNITANPPCTITVGTDSPIFEFTAATDPEFDTYVPWFESRNTNETPTEGFAFCYAVVSKNARGSSNLSSIECGAINQPLTLNSNWGLNLTVDDTAVEPQGISWDWITTQTDTPNYELYRCQTNPGEATCTPAISENQLVQDSPLKTFNESISDPSNPRPEEGTAYCYAVRAISSTEVGPLSGVSCGAPRPRTCTLDLPSLGFGIPQNFQPSDSDAARATLRGIVNSGANSGETFPIITVNQTSALGSDILHTIEADGVTVAPSATPVPYPCDTEITLRWDASDLASTGPLLSITPPNPLGGYQDFLPRLTWTNLPGTVGSRIYTCETNLPAPNNCTPTSLTANLPDTTEAWQSVTPPASGSRLCFHLVSFSPTENEPANVVCGEFRP